MNLRRHIPVALLALFVLGTLSVTAQQMPVTENQIPRQFPQVSLVFNRIFNGSGLDTFYQRLQQLKKTRHGKVTIVHIGDSHLKSDNLPGVIRNGFRDFFGPTASAGPNHRDSSGIHYEVISINGARFETFNQSPAFLQQAIDLKPDLFIVSLGTNDAQVNSYNETIFQQDLSQLLGNLKKASPASAILVTTTADSFKRGNPNRELWNINIALMSYCTAQNIPVWDMYRVTNGFGSAWNWWRKGMLSPDGIHFTAQAYKVQGQLLYNALAKGYNSYISNY
ncbi:MAG: GDSL-type esterase/lipase family protein [Chitinophagaceae bacterium]